ncbi:MAG: hypothetical protein ACNS62_05460 [Candidatus Cyclobacteriaceae bacterium M3_2C_046]
MKKIFGFFASIGTGIINLIKAFFMGIYNLIKLIFVTLYNGMVYTGNAIVNLITLLIHTAIDLFKKVFIIPFLPRYKVVFSMYQVVPGFPVNKSDSIHDFAKGTSKKAYKFYDDVVKSTTSNKIVPSEVQLIRRKKVVATQQFGPVAEIKKFNIQG